MSRPIARIDGALGIPHAPRALGVARRLAAWIDIGAQRRRLAELDERMLRDIGISREDALREAGRPFWDRP